MMCRDTGMFRTQTGLSRKIMHRLLIAYLFISIITITAIVGVMFQGIYQSSRSQARDILSQLSSNYENSINDAKGYVETLSIMPDLNQLILSYQQEGGE